MKLEYEPEIDRDKTKCEYYIDNFIWEIGNFHVRMRTLCDVLTTVSCVIWNFPQNNQTMSACMSTRVGKCALKT